MRVLLLAIGVLGVWMGTACKRDFTFRSSGVLRFDADTLRFDTLFQNRLSPHLRLRFYNTQNYGLRVDEIYIAGGEDSPFRLVVDGVPGQRHTGYELLATDSAYAFVQLSPTLSPGNGHQWLRDELVFRVGEQEQRIPIELFLLNAYFYQDTVLACPGGSYTFPSDTLIVVDGYIIVPESCTCTILAGTRLHFTPRRDEYYNPFSQLVVAGKLNVQGQPGNPVLFTHLRFGEDYRVSPGDWLGIRFAGVSSGNRIDYAIVQNSALGVNVDSLTPGFEPKLVLSNSIIRHSSYYGILATGRTQWLDDQTGPLMLDAYNTLVYGCGQNVVAALIGGRYRFTHCTFADNQWHLQRGSTVFAYSEYLRYEENGVQFADPYPGNLQLVNCIVWGGGKEEIIIDTRPGSVAIVSNNLIKTELPNLGGVNGNIVNQYPQFVEFTNSSELNFRLQESSPARGAAVGVGLATDLDNLPRDAQPDIGAYEWRPE